MGLKPPLSYDDQIERLKKNGVEIPDYETALSILSEANKFKPVSGTRKFSQMASTMLAYINANAVGINCQESAKNTMK